MEKECFLYVIYDVLNCSRKIKLVTLVVDEATCSLKLQTICGDKYCLSLTTTDEQL
ncbi:hypothetical protein MCG98_09720 [Ruminococcus sp. OA3]|uniref:hypothetical protein n=1 Tax=Ruminococcus sp. OA3 TaxID=2914164 RepID=UPI001F05B215|nr:hypothetical protein [Ruminococcus sp. OA3]MCH1982842.1 hypothetical protein [Ruminococcus sp. OA3]